ncbi:flagellar hook-length control protein FliK [Alicyclobacillus sp.]|uniref:flagellar hook-length control protein FliK n=1 Tax=Alicyclobacillus sp. TaxID=61169 RepID=UPI0025C57C41|nr:flagellar hook-length control protein FliK [Alicyclobacillus sp.]MCL6515634.1 flagellar hook-length control protein FliK [Alicyclobacillus sp.]
MSASDAAERAGWDGAHAVSSQDGLQGLAGAPTPSANALVAQSAPSGNSPSGAHPIVRYLDAQAAPQLAGLVVQSVDHGVQQVQVRVHPEGLGDLTLTVHRTDAGVRVELAAAQWSTGQWLTGLTGQLTDAIRASGVAVASVQVVFGGWTGQADAGGNRSRQGASSHGDGPGEREVTEGSRTARIKAVSSGPPLGGWRGLQA